MRLVAPKIYIAFRKVFGDEGKKGIPISFLYAALGLSGGNEIYDTTTVNHTLPQLEGRIVPLTKNFYFTNTYTKIAATLLLYLFVVISGVIALPADSWSLAGADVAIYNDTSYSSGGSWVTGITAIKGMLSYYGYTYEDVTPTDINNVSNLNSLYKMIIVGGGWAGGYNTYVNHSGFDNIRNFVNNGGAYFGICAGAYFASRVVMFKEEYPSPINYYEYPLGLFGGVSLGAIVHIMGWNTPTGCSSATIAKGATMTAINVDKSVLPNVNSSLSILYYGGPFFIPLPSQAVKTVATYQSVGAPSDGYAAMIMFKYGNGKIFLSGPHPEISFSNCSFWYDINTWTLMKDVIAQLIGK
ncbi:MAG: hypothetical protein HQL06_14615 [Nitrospirae bacterium]|nr:hypothetical protein [Nitrospirota bacterium]